MQTRTVATSRSTSSGPASGPPRLASTLGRPSLASDYPPVQALFLHLAHTAFEELQGVVPQSLFNTHGQGIWPDSHGPLFDFFETTIAHVVFSLTAIELFANEVIPATFTYSWTRKGQAELLDKAEIEPGLGLNQSLQYLQ